MESESDFQLLEELFQKSLNDPQDAFAISMFATMIRNDSLLLQKAIQLILDKAKSNIIPQSLKALEILEECMSKSGPEFQSEISKYRFLNELSKLVSKKYDGDKTLKEIKDKIMNCFLLWTEQYPEKEKIRSVYECLKKEEDTSNSINCSDQRKSNLIDEESEKKLKRLLQSTSKEDIDKANLLIQYFVKQDEKKRERVIQQKAELVIIQNTVQIFNDVIDAYIEKKSDDKSLLKDLYTSCTKYKNMMNRMPDIMEDSEEELIRETIRVNESLLAVIEKYNKIESITSEKLIKSVDENQALISQSQDLTNQRLDDLLSGPFDQSSISKIDLNQQENPLDELAELFSPNINSDCLTPAQVVKGQITEQSKLNKTNTTNLSKNQSFLSTIDTLSEDLFKKSLSSPTRNKTFDKETSKVSLNELSKKSKYNINVDELEKNNDIANLLDKNENLNVNIEKFDAKNVNNVYSLPKNEELLTLQIKNQSETSTEKVVQEPTIETTKPKINYLRDIEINLNDVEPSSQEPIILLDSKEGLKVTLNFTKNKPSDDISVIVVSTINQSQLSIDDLQFDAFVNKPSKLRLLQKSGNSLPGVKPFSPPSDCLQQIMLIFNPTKEPLKITYTFSYKQGDDPDPIKESLSSSIPYLN